MHTVSLILAPADVAMFRDNRPFNQGTLGAQSQFPNPQTVAGAVRTWLLRSQKADLRKLSDLRSNRNRQQRSLREDLRDCCPPEAEWVLDAELCGPMLFEPLTATTYFAVPRLVAELEGPPKRLQKTFPLSDALPGRMWTSASPDGEPLRPVWPQDRTREAWQGIAAGFLDNILMEYEVLATHRGLKAEDIAAPDALLGYERRLGIALEMDRKIASDALIYTAHFLRLKPGYAFRIDIRTAQDVSQTVQALCTKAPWLRLGGEGKVATVACRADLSWPVAPTPWPPPSGRFFTCLATPGLFAEGQPIPQNLARTCTLVAMLVGEPVILSGWDLHAAAPGRTRCAVPAGAVYFWELNEGAALSDPHTTCISDSPDDRQAGWGFCLRGDWNDV
jgi:CRISPR-associated protein Cmr3